LLEVSELGHFHTVEPDFPTQTPGTQCRIFPVVFDETHVILLQIQSQCFERTQVQIQNVFRCRLEDDLKLVVVLHAVGIFSVTAILGTTRWLHIRSAPRLGADGAQKSGGMRRTGADFHA